MSTPSGTPSSARHSMFIVPRAAGDEADADLDEARVRLGRRLHRVAAEAQLEAAAERHVVRRGDDRHARVLHPLRRVLVALDHLAHAVPLLLAGRHHDREQVRADAEELALVPDHHARGSPARRARPRRGSS